VLTTHAGAIRCTDKLTRCRFRGRRSNHGPANRGCAFRSYFTSPFFAEIEFSVGTGGAGASAPPV